MSRSWIWRVAIAAAVIAVVLVVFWVYCVRPYGRVLCSRDARSVPEMGDVIAGFALPGEAVCYAEYRPIPYFTVIVTGRARPESLRAFCAGRLTLYESVGERTDQRHRDANLARFAAGDGRIQCDFGPGDWFGAGQIGNVAIELHYRPDDRVFTLLASSRGEVRLDAGGGKGQDLPASRHTD